MVNNAKNAHIIASFGNDGNFLQLFVNTGFRDDCLYVSVSTSPISLDFIRDVPLHDVENMIDAIKSDEIEVDL